MYLYINKHRNIKDIHPYTYIVVDKITNKKYHGVRWANVKNKIPPIDDLGIHYFTSRKSLARKFKANPENFRFFICWTFDSIKDAITYESNINEKLIYLDSWLNERGSCATVLSNDSKKKISKKSKENWKKEDYRNYMSNMMKEKWANKEYKDKVKQSQIERWKNIDIDKSNYIGSKNYNAKVVTLVHRDGTKITLNGSVCKWCKENSIPYKYLRMFLNTDEFIKIQYKNGKIIKEFPWKCYSSNIDGYGIPEIKTKQLKKYIIVYDSGERDVFNGINELNSFLKKYCISFVTVCKFINKGINVEKRINRNTIDKCFDWKIYSYKL